MRQSGFTIIEVLMALGVLTLAVSIIASLQLRALTRIMRDRDMVEKIFYLKKEMHLQCQKTLDEHSKKRTVNKLEHPEMTLSTDIEKVHLKSKLADWKDRLLTMRTKALWKYDKEERTVDMIAYILKPRSEKEKKHEN